jgi:prephenate dehydratase
MTMKEFENKVTTMKTGEVISALVDSINLCIVSRAGDTWSEVHKTFSDPDNFDFTKTFMRRDTFEVINFFPTGTITEFLQKRNGELSKVTCFRPFNLKEYIVANLFGFRW